VEVEMAGLYVLGAIQILVFGFLFWRLIRKLDGLDALVNLAEKQAGAIVALERGVVKLTQEIQRLEGEIERREGLVKNYIVFDHTRNEILEQASGFVTKGGKVKITGSPFKIDSKHIGNPVWLFAVLADGEETKLFGEVIK